MKLVMNRYACLVSVLVLFTLCNVAPAAVMDMYVSYVFGVKKYAYDTTTHMATEDENFSLPTVTEQLQQPQGILVGPDNLLYVAGQDSHTVSRYNRTTGDFVDVLATWGASYAPTGISFGPDNSGDGVPDLYVAQWSGTVDRVPTAGADAGTIYTFTSGGSLTMTSDVAIGPDNNLYAVGVSKFVEKFDGTNGAWISTFATQADNSISLEFSADGSSLFTTRYVKLPNGGINKFDGTSGATIAEPFGTGVTYGMSAVVGPDHNGNGVDDIYVGHPIAPDNGSQVDVFDGLTGDNIGPLISLDRPKFVAFAVPEPSTAVIFTTSLLGLLAYAWRKRK